MRSNIGAYTDAELRGGGSFAKIVLVFIGVWLFGLFALVLILMARGVVG